MELFGIGLAFVVVSFLLGGATGRGSLLAAWLAGAATIAWWVGLMFAYPTAGLAIGGVAWLGWAFAAAAYGFGFIAGVATKQYGIRQPAVHRFDTLFDRGDKWRWGDRRE